MEFLLILSAMLSAVTGVFTGARAPELRPLHVASVGAETPCAETMVRIARAQVRIPEQGRQVAAVFAAAPAFDLPRPVALATDRLIE